MIPDRTQHKPEELVLQWDARFRGGSSPLIAMQTELDPYHIWLGIPPQEQPPNHYRLLGITLFESNADVIATAADRQMGHLRTFQSGKHSELSQRLLNKVAGTKVCLLKPAKKVAYDEQLRQQLSPPEDATLAAADSTPWAQPIPVPDTEESSQWADITNSPPSSARKWTQLRTGEGITVALGKGAVPFSSDENRDSSPLTDSPVLTTVR